MKKAHKGVLYAGVFLCLTHVSMAKDGFSLGGVVALDNKHVGGGFEVGFPLLQKGFTIRNYISVCSRKYKFSFIIAGKNHIWWSKGF